jgi:integrase/recombinase XerD
VRFKSKENNRQSLQHVVAYLRAFLRFCGEHGRAPAGLDIIDTPRVYRGELPPRALDWTIVRQLLASIRRRSPRDWRDYTTLHLMAYYGLRPSEVATLRLDAIDWEAATLRVEQWKTRSILVLPLTSRTLRLLHRYLQIARPNSDLPQLFLRIRSPIKAMSFVAEERTRIDIFDQRLSASQVMVLSIRPGACCPQIAWWRGTPA